MNSLSFQILILAGILISGCTLGPDYSRPNTPLTGAEGYTNLPAEWSIADVNDIGRWWESFGDPVTNDLVEAALANNYDLKKAASRVVESEALLRASHGIRLPNVSYSASKVRTKFSFIAPGGRASFISQNYDQNLRISYVMDIFGKLKRNEQAALADLYASSEARRALSHSIVAQVVQGRIRVATQQRLLSSAVSNIKSRGNTLKVVERRYNNGLTSSLDVYLARENLAAAQAAEPLVRQSLILAQHSLDVLCGRLAGAEGVLPEVLPDMQPPGPVPVGLPAALLDRRPDVRAAEMQLAAATELIGASIAEMFPDFTLTATGGYSSDSYRMLSATENQVYSFLMNLAAPIYKGGSLKARVEAAEARRDQAISNYGQVILTAFREVEDALVRQRELFTQTELLKIRHTEALRGEKLAQDRYSKGLESVLVILDTERRRRRAEDELTVTMGRLYGARVALFLALGGDWQINTNETGVNDG